MKKISIIFALFLISCSLVQATPQFTSFTVISNWLQNGRIKVYNNGTTEFIAKIGASRASNGPIFETVTMELVFYAQIGTTEHVLKTVTLTSSDFDGPYLAYYNEEPSRPSAANNLVLIGIPQNVERSDIRVKYRYKDANDEWYPNTTYGFRTFNTFYQTVNIGTPYPPVFDPTHLSVIQARGFSTANIVNYDSNHYLVEGDVLIKKSSLSATSNFIVNNSYEHNINIVVSGAVRHSSWFGAIYGAIGAWNAMPNSDIKFHFILENPNGGASNPRRDIYIEQDLGSFPASLAALTEFPNGDGKPGGLIRVNYDFGNDYSKMTNHIIHALAHAVGIKHDENTPSIMRSSIMTQATTTSYAGTFPVQEDALKINTMYPFNSSSIVIPYISGLGNLYSNGGDVFLMSYYNNHMPSHLGYEWKTVEPEGNEFLWTNEFGFATHEIGFPSGTFNLRSTLIDPKYANPIVATKQLIVQ